MRQFPWQQNLRHDAGLTEVQVKQLISVAGDHTATEAEWVQACLLLGDRPPELPKKRRNGRLALILGSVVLVSAGGLWYALSQNLDTPRNGLDQFGTSSYKPTPGIPVPPASTPLPGIPIVDPLATTEPGAVYYDRFMARMERKIKRNWRPAHSDVSRHIKVIFKVHPNGEMSDLRVEESSGVDSADAAALKAVEAAAPFGPLPAGSVAPVDIQFTFAYNVFQK